MRKAQPGGITSARPHAAANDMSVTASQPGEGGGTEHHGAFLRFVDLLLQLDLGELHLGVSASSRRSSVS